jgi:DNA polymerase/3'-5' exonuclease PolX
LYLSEALLVAENVKQALEPYCHQIEIAGSVLRRDKNPHDVEIVCIPKDRMIESDLFGEPIRQRDPQFVKMLRGTFSARDGVWKLRKGDPYEGRMVQIAIVDEDEDEIPVDIFMARHDNWGVILAIRTGPADFSHYCIAKRAHRYGLRIQGGMLTRNGEPIPCPTEEILFKHLNLPEIPPQERGTKKVLDGFG